MSRPRPYRVRVKIITESWVDVMAVSHEEAERLAAKVNGVVGVFGRSAVLAEQKAGPEPAIYIDGDDILDRNF